MCGITGIVCADRRPASPVLVRRMTDALEHRGPDGEGFFVEGSVGFGHRRLSIIDLSSAGRPADDDGRRPPRSSRTTARPTTSGSCGSELEALGHRFRSRTDSEVVLEAYARVGHGAVEPPQRHVRVRGAATREHARASSWRATGYGDQAALLRRAGRDRCSSRPRSRRCLRTRTCRVEHRPATRCSSTSPSRTSSATARCSAASRSLPAGCTLTVRSTVPAAATLPERYWDFAFEEPRAVGRAPRSTSPSSIGSSGRRSSRQLVSDVPRRLVPQRRAWTPAR